MDYENLTPLPQPSFFTNRNGYKLAYIQQENSEMTLVFLHGYMSDMYGDKSAAIYGLAQEKNLGFLALEYTGNGQSEGDFIQDGSISCWANDALELIEQKTTGRLVLIGSSMGGWISLWLAKRLKERVAAFIGIAPAPDFTADIMPEALGHEGMETLMKDGVIYEPNEWAEDGHVPWTKKLYEDGLSQHVMSEDFGLPHIKVRLLHGLADDVVPWQRSVKIAQWLNGNDVELWLPKDGNHRLSTIRDLKRLNATIKEVLAL
ncbi:MAG: alpha/beta hydrolase [Alphaproteobacteria bacterium]